MEIEDTQAPTPLTTAEFARLIRRHPSTIRRWCQRYDIPVIVMPSGIRAFPVETTTDWLIKRFGIDQLRQLAGAPRKNKGARRRGGR